MQKSVDRTQPTLSVLQASAMLIGIVVGVGIFKTPALVAQHSPNEFAFIGLWLLGGALMIVGALCYAELASTYPDAGGEYHFLTRAYGHPVGFIFAWGRMTVMQTGAIAAVAFVYGDYANVLVPWGAWGPGLHGALAVAAFTLLQLLGTKLSARTQLVFEVLTIGAILFVAAIGFSTVVPAAAAPVETSAPGAAIGLAMVFILLTYGGWNEAAYLSGEVENPRRNMVRVLLIGSFAVIALYLIVNMSLLSAFGLEGLARSEAAVAQLVGEAFGANGAIIVSTVVALAALTTLNVTIFTGARTNFALGRNFAPLAVLGSRDQGNGAPRAALVVQALITLALVAFGAQARDGFATMVEYTAPVFWGFLLLVGVSLFIFRQREQSGRSAFRVPLYPLTPIIFIVTCAYLLYSSLVYTGVGALVGVAVLLIGIPVYLLGQRRVESTSDVPQEEPALVRVSRDRR